MRASHAYALYYRTGMPLLSSLLKSPDTRRDKGIEEMESSPRLTPLRDQFAFGRGRLLDRLQGMTNAEYLWEPVLGCWNIRPRERTQATHSYGGGPWVIELTRPAPEPAPFPTLAWRLCHLDSGMRMRADYTNGTHAMGWNDYVVPGSAADGIASLTAACDAWQGALAGTTDADLDRVGRCAFPYGLDPTLPFSQTVWWVNQELLHHGAEIALLRDLYRAQPH
jgi:hypothetical protein